MSRRFHLGHERSEPMDLRDRSAARQSGRPIVCVYLTSSLWAATEAFHILTPANIRLCRAVTLREARLLLRILPSRVLLVDTIFDDGQWADALEAVQREQLPVCVVVATAAYESDLWAAILRAGGFDVVLKPFSRLTLVHAVQDAHRHACGFDEDRKGRPALEEVGPAEEKQASGAIKGTSTAPAQARRRCRLNPTGLCRWLKRAFRGADGASTTPGAAKRVRRRPA